VVIPRPLLAELIAHAREDAPDECCGMIGTRDGTAVVVHRTENADHSPLRYTIEPRDQLRAVNAIDDAGLELGAIYHSHTRSDPIPSQTDINMAANWPDPIYLIVGVKDPDNPDVRGWRIADGGYEPVELTVEG
jgi:proteasome lid subunit RPN8/RPN11